MAIYCIKFYRGTPFECGGSYVTTDPTKIELAFQAMVRRYISEIMDLQMTLNLFKRDTAKKIHLCRYLKSITIDDFVLDRFTQKGECTILKDGKEYNPDEEQVDISVLLSDEPERSVVTFLPMTDLLETLPQKALTRQKAEEWIEYLNEVYDLTMSYGFWDFINGEDSEFEYTTFDPTAKAEEVPKEGKARLLELTFSIEDNIPYPTEQGLVVAYPKLGQLIQERLLDVLPNDIIKVYIDGKREHRTDFYIPGLHSHGPFLLCYKGDGVVELVSDPTTLTVGGKIGPDHWSHALCGTYHLALTPELIDRIKAINSDDANYDPIDDIYKFDLPFGERKYRFFLPRRELDNLRRDHKGDLYIKYHVPSGLMEMKHHSMTDTLKLKERSLLPP